MLANIYRTINENRIILQRFLVNKNTHEYVGRFFQLTEKKSYSTFALSRKNILRHSTNFRIEDKGYFLKKKPLSSLPIHNTDKKVDKWSDFDWNSIPTTVELVSNFENFCNSIDLLGEIPAFHYDNLLQAISLSTSNFSEEEIAQLLKSLKLWRRCKNYKKVEVYQIFQVLDKECVNRFLNLDIESKLMLCKFLCSTGFGKKSQFMYKVIMKTHRKIKSLTPEQSIDYIKYVRICKHLPLNFYEMEYALEQNMLMFSAYHLSLISECFFQNNYLIRSEKFMLHILETFLQSIDTLGNNVISSFAKIIRSSYKRSDKVDDIIREIFKALEPKLDTLNLLTLSHLSDLAAHVKVHEEKFMNSILERYNKILHQARLPEIERVTYCMAMLNYDSSNSLYENIVKELSNPARAQEIEDHRRSFTFTLKSLVIANIYPINLLEKALDPEFVQKTYFNKYVMRDDYYFLDQSIAAELPNYTGPRLSDDLINHLGKKLKGLSASNDRIIHLFSGLKEVMAVCERLLNTTSGVYADIILPHFDYPDVIICLDEKNNPIPPEPLFSTMQHSRVKPIPEEAKKYKVLVLIMSSKRMTIKSNEDFDGVLAAKYRQLKTLGYTPIVVSMLDWYAMNDEENCDKLREDYIKKLLNIQSSVD